MRCALLFSIILVGCAPRPGFTQMRGFKEWYRAHPPADEIPSAHDRALLERFQPRIFLPAGGEGPIDFYRDYIASGTLFDGHGGTIASNPSQKTLNAWKHAPLATFVHRELPEEIHPTLYGRIDRETFHFSTGDERFTFLTWTAVFRHSGLPPTIPLGERMFLRMFGSLTDWHQLDDDTQVMLALDSNDRPVAVTMQEHNGQHTMIVGDGIEWPADDRIAVDVAIGSNELYPHKAGPAHRRAIAFPSSDGFRWLILGDKKPLMAADDLTDPAREQPCTLTLLPPSDAFYLFEGFLGARRKFPGREGPPGADYNVPPQLKPRAAAMIAAFWREGNREDLARIQGAFANVRGFDGLLDAISRVVEVQADAFERVRAQPASAPSP